MNKMTSAVATAALAVTAVAITAGTASAAPAAPATPASSTDMTKLSMDILPGVHYSSDIATHSVVIATALGTITEQGSQYNVQDSHGKTVYGKPVTPTAAASKTARVVGSAAVKSVAAPLHDIDWTADFNSDLAVAATQFGLAAGLGGMIGGITGVTLGCPIGAATGGLLFVPEAALGGLALVAGCLAGAGLLGTIGPVVGGALLGVPVGIASAVQMYNTMHAAHEVSAPTAAPAHAAAMVARAHA